MILWDALSLSLSHLGEELDETTRGGQMLCRFGLTFWFTLSGKSEVEGKSFTKLVTHLSVPTEMMALN